MQISPLVLGDKTSIGFTFCMVTKLCMRFQVWAIAIYFDSAGLTLAPFTQLCEPDRSHCVFTKFCVIIPTTFHGWIRYQHIITAVLI